MIKMTGGITSGTFSLLSQLAITTIERGGERILSRGILGGEQLQAVLEAPVGRCAGAYRLSSPRGR